MGQVYTLLLSLGINALCVGALVTIILNALSTVQKAAKEPMTGRLEKAIWRMLQHFFRISTAQSKK